MDIEFHYYITYLIAARAGFKPADAAIIAQASQGVDDNHIPIEVQGGPALPYRNDLSQTMDILRPHHDARIYPIFHFIPGDPNAPTARRKDGRKHAWVTTPNSPLANAMLATALNSGSLHRIGASAHAYCDTWAHQNFVGREDSFNVVPYAVDGLVRKLTKELYDKGLQIGHALAEHMPDLPGLVWRDDRLADEIATVNNRDRFVDAAAHLFAKLYQHNHGSAPPQADILSLKADLTADIGQHDVNNTRLAARLSNYKNRAFTPAYGGTAIPEYDPGRWSNAAFVEDQKSLAAELAQTVADAFGDFGDALRDAQRVKCTWRDPHHFESTDWYMFQEAIRSHLDECWTILTKRLPDIAGTH